VQAEAIAQARAIARLNDASAHGDRAGAGFITANLQWEVLYSSGRIDLLMYDRADPNGPIELADARRWQTQKGGLPGEPPLLLSCCCLVA
jgi:hypothetical protein